MMPGKVDMQVAVELSGLARRLSGEKEVAVELSNGATLRDVVVALAERPAGQWIQLGRMTDNCCFS